MQRKLVTELIYIWETQVFTPTSNIFLWLFPSVINRSWDIYNPKLIAPRIRSELQRGILISGSMWDHVGPYKPGFAKKVMQHSSGKSQGFQLRVLKSSLYKLQGTWTYDIWQARIRQETSVITPGNTRKAKPTCLGHISSPRSHNSEAPHESGASPVPGSLTTELLWRHEITSSMFIFYVLDLESLRVYV